MTFYLLILILGLSLFTFVSYLILHLGKVEHLKKVTQWLVISLPFERIPSLDSPFGTLRISQILVILGIWIFLVLLARGDKELVKLRLNHKNLYFLAFFVFSIPSFLFLLDFNRFLVTFVGTVLVFGAFFLISNFLFEITKTIKKLALVLFAVGIFSWYQLVADLAGIPQALTGLRDGYTKEVFGIARIHGTALEPSYYSMMLLLPMFLGIVLFLYHSNKFKTHKTLFTHPIIITIFFGSTILLTLSKAAYFTIAVILLILLIPIFKNRVFKRFQYFLQLLATAFTFGLAGVLFVDPVRRVFNNFMFHIGELLIGRAATIVQRGQFLEYALIGIREYLFTGIGSGQFGHYVERLTGDSETLVWIVNNVYVEVWLEFGLISFLVFMAFLVSILYAASKTLQNIWDKPINLDYVIFLSLLVTCIGCLIFWLFVSPIFMMPVFIYLGLLVRANFFLDVYNKFK
jgi:O-antigen ligase